MALSLFTYEHTSLARPANDPGRLALGQYPTPIWVAEHLVERYFPDLDNNDCVLEPTCGPGHFLQAIPVQVPAFGIEIDPTLAELARRRTGREIICGDALTIDLAIRPTVLVGNPPFQSEFIDRLLERAHEWLPAGGRAGFILPAYYFQSARRTVRHLERWSIAQEMIPRSIFPRFKSPLVFALFTKDRRKTMIGFALYTEAASAEQIDRRFRRIIEQGGRSIWKQVVELVLDLLGGEANLQQIYALIEPRRPTPNPFRRKKIRQICQLHFVRTGPGRYAMA